MLIRSKTSLFAFMVIILIAASTAAFGQATAAVSTPAAAVPSKIAFVNLQDAVGSCNEGKKESAALQQRFQAKQNALKAQDDELKKLKDSFQAVSGTLNEDERTARAKVIQDKQKAFERSLADYQSESQEAQQEAVNRIVKKMLPLLEKYASENGYTAIFDLSNPQAPPVLWIRKEALITQKLVDIYNAETAAPAAPGPAATAPKP